MSSPDTLYDEAIELQQAGKLEDAIKRLEDLARSQPEFALAHAGLEARFTVSRSGTARPSSRRNWCVISTPTTRSATWQKASSASGPG